MNTLFLILSLLFSLSSFWRPCWPEVDHARTIVESVISHPNWESERSETGTNDLNVSQIQLLTNPLFSQKCEVLNEELSEGIAKRSGPNNDRTYDHVYYKVGNFYFVVVVLAQPSDPEYVSIGLSFIMVYDEDLNYLAGYSF